MADAADLKSASRKGSGGSNPFLGTTVKLQYCSPKLLTRRKSSCMVFLLPAFG